MEDTIVQSIEKLICDKILLYNDLLHCFMEERDSLINIDLDKLWRISEEKEEICSKIDSIRQEIISAANPSADQEAFNLNQILGMIPRENKPKFQELYQVLIRLNGEVQALRKENKLFINDSLNFLDEIISIITGHTESKIMYNNKRYITESGANMLLRREA